MSDLYLEPAPDGGTIRICPSGDAKATSALGNAVYLSLFTPAYWGNAIAEPEERYTSRIDELMRDAVTLRTRNAIAEAAKSSLAWMLSLGVAASVTVEAEIASRERINLLVTITEPNGTETTYRYALNWTAQEATLI